MTAGNQGKISVFRRIEFLFTGRYSIKEQTQESVLVRSLKQEIRIQKNIIEKQSVFIDELSTQVEFKQETNVQEKMLNMAAEFLKPKTSIPTNPKLVTESGHTINSSVDLDDEQLKEIIGTYEPSKIKQALLFGDNFVIEKIGAEYPQLSQASLLKGLEIAKGIVKNG